MRSRADGRRRRLQTRPPTEIETEGGGGGGGTSEPFRVLFLAISSLTAGRGIVMHPGRFWGTLKICSVRGNNTVLMTITSMHIIISVCNVVLSAEILEKLWLFPRRAVHVKEKEEGFDP